jgi:YebC/PmpR family DNA-binding regulatory protein
MAGHSKWANIKQRKGAQDKRRSKLFSKVVKDIMVAARLGGPDPDANARLRLAILKAKAVSLPRDTLDRAVKKGAGLLGGELHEEVMYEGYGPGGVAILIECLTDNRNRTAPEIRAVFGKRGLSLAASGAAAHSFRRVGQVLVSAEGTTELELLEVAMEFGGEDLIETEDDQGDTVFQTICEIGELEALREGLEQGEFTVKEYGLTWLPTVEVPVEGKDADKLLNLIEALEDLDDTQNVYANFEVSDEEMERLAGS